MKRSIKNVLMLVSLFITLLLLVVTVFKATNERVVVGVSGGDPGGGGMGGTTVDGVLILKDGTKIYADGTGERPDGTLLTWEDVKLLMPDNLDAPPGEGGGDVGAPPGEGGGDAPMEGPTINELNKKYYIYFGVESLVFLLILAYLLLSKLNKKDFNETFDDKLKFILLAIIAVFGTAIFTYASGFISDIWAEKLAETNEVETQNQAGGAGQTTTPDANQGTTGTETTDPNAGAIPEGGENMLPEGNPEVMEPNAGMQTLPGEATTPEQGMGTMPPEGTAQPSNPGEGGGMPPQMP